MKIRLNGEDRDLPDGATVRDLLRAIGLDREGIAVAVDREVVPKTRHATHPLADGANVEVIRAVGGG